MPKPESKFFVSVPLTPYHAEAFHEPDEIGRGQEKAQLRDEHNGAKECRGKSCQKNPTNKDGKKPKPVDLEHLY